MIRLHVDDESLQTTRLAFSPLWETIGSLGVLARYRGAAPSPYRNWIRSVYEGMPADLARLLDDAVPRHDPLGFLPDFAPIPNPVRNTIDAELRQLRETHINSQAAEGFINLLERHWEWAIAPHWTAISSSLEEEILLRGRTLATGGVDSMLADLGGRVSWAKPILTAPYHCDLDFTLARTKVILVPTVFATGIRLFVAKDDAVAMSYQARATGNFNALTDSGRPRVVEDRLALLVGKGRAHVMCALVAPSTTTGLAQALGVAKSTVSQHLSVLVESGMVWKQRLGGQVVYQLDPAGLMLLRQLGYDRRGVEP
jgi:DNA-binding transcriptional ArsR family regulator